MPRYYQLFWSFFKIGSFTIGGGYAMIPLMETELVEKRKWLEKEDFLDTISLAQAMPGVFAVNMATNIGYKKRGSLGACVAVLGNVLVPICIIILLAIFFRHFSENPIVERVFKGIRPAVVALIAVPVFKMAKTAKISWRNAWIPIVATFLIWLFNISPVLIILTAGFGGYLYGKITNRKRGAK